MKRFLVRIVATEEYARNFAEGKIFMNSLGYYRALGIDQFGKGAYRGDVTEGLSGYISEGKFEVQIGDTKLAKTDLCGPLVYRRDSLLNLNALCLFSIMFPRTKKYTVHEIHEGFQIPRHMREFGDYVVIFCNPNEVIKRIAVAATAQGFELKHGAVRYNDDPDDIGILTADEVGLCKPGRYREQSEYRILVNQKSKDPTPLILDVGNLTDVVRYCTVDNFLTGLKVHIKSNPHPN